MAILMCSSTLKGLGQHQGSDGPSAPFCSEHSSFLPPRPRPSLYLLTLAFTQMPKTMPKVAAHRKQTTFSDHEELSFSALKGYKAVAVDESHSLSQSEWSMS